MLAKAYIEHEVPPHVEEESWMRSGMCYVSAAFRPSCVLPDAAALSALRAAHCLQAAKGLPAEDGSSSGSSTRPDGSSSEERSHCLSPDSAPAVALMNPPRIHGHSLHPATIQDAKLWSRTVPHCPSCSAPPAGWDLDRSCANARNAPSRQLLAQGNPSRTLEF